MISSIFCAFRTSLPPGAPDEGFIRPRADSGSSVRIPFDLEGGDDERELHLVRRCGSAGRLGFDRRHCRARGHPLAKPQYAHRRLGRAGAGLACGRCLLADARVVGGRGLRAAGFPARWVAHVPHPRGGQRLRRVRRGRQALRAHVRSRSGRRRARRRDGRLPLAHGHSGRQWFSRRGRYRAGRQHLCVLRRGLRGFRRRQPFQSYAGGRYPLEPRRVRQLRRVAGLAHGLHQRPRGQGRR